MTPVTYSPTYHAEHRVRLGPMHADMPEAVGCWHEADSPSGTPICNQPCPDYHDREGKLQHGSWEHDNSGGNVECHNCARVKSAR